MGFVKSSPCQAYLYLSYNPIPHHIPPLQLASNPCATSSGYRRQLGIQSRPRTSFANLSIYPYPYPLLSLSIYYFPFAFRQSTSHHHHCSCKTHRPVSHPTSVFTTPAPAPTQNTSKSSHCILIIYWHLRIHTFTFCWIARRPPPTLALPCFSISTWKTTVNPLDTSPSFVTFFCPFCVVLWFLTDYTSVFLRRTLPLRLAHALAPTRTEFIILRASLPPRHTALGRRSHLIPSYSAIHSSLCFPTCRLFLSYLYRYPYPCVSLVLCPVSLSH